MNFSDFGQNATVNQAVFLIICMASTPLNIEFAVLTNVKYLHLPQIARFAFFITTIPFVKDIKN